jgi:hypothetical protein
MARYTIVVLSNPVDGREEEYNQWYDTVHIPELVALPGVRSARRLRLADDRYAACDHRYLVVYECDFASPDEGWAIFDQARAEGRSHSSDAMDTASTKAWFFEEIDHLNSSEGISVESRDE